MTAGTPTTRTVWLPKALPHQLPILLSPARFKVVACGRRWGKTATGLMATIRGHGPKRGVFLGAVDGAKVWWVAPTYPIANEIIWPDLKKATAGAWTDKSEVEHYIALPGGGTINVKSADKPDSLRGVGLDGLVFDEAAFAVRQVWTDVLRPALSDRRGWAMFLTTPNGHNWFHDLFQHAASGGEWERWLRPSSDNPLMAADELEAAKKEIGLRAYAQEYEAQFTEQEGAEFPGHYFGDQAWFDDWPAERLVRWRLLVLDPSKGKTDKSDYSAFILLALTWDGIVYVDADLEQRDWRTIEQDGEAIAREFQPHAFASEINQFQELLHDQMKERLRKIGVLDFYGIDNRENKRVRIRRLNAPLADGLIKFKRDSRGAKLLVEQLRAFPMDAHDDGPDALEMAVRLVGHVLSVGGVGVDEPTGPERIVA